METRTIDSHQLIARSLARIERLLDLRRRDVSEVVALLLAREKPGIREMVCAGGRSIRKRRTGLLTVRLTPTL